MAKTKSYSATAKSLHWLIVVLLAAQFTVAWLMPHIGRNTPVTTLINLHFSFGVIILVIAIIRLAWRATHAEPAPLDGRRRARELFTGCCICCFLPCRYWDGSTLHGAACRL
jgi:cytochrome b561